MKEFIQKHKDEFEGEKPSSDLWSKIEKELPETQVRRMVPASRLWQMAAGLTAVFVLAFFALQYDSTTNIAEVTPQSEDEITNVDQLEQFYAVQVQNKMEALSVYQVDEELLQEVQFLKEEFELLKEEAGLGVNQEDILDEMIDNYRLRVNILEDIMKEMNKQSNQQEDVVQ